MTMRMKSTICLAAAYTGGIAAGCSLASQSHSITLTLIGLFLCVGSSSVNSLMLYGKGL